MSVKIESNNDILAEVILESIGWTITERDICMEDCPICLDSIYFQYTITTPCNHTFHRNCLLVWLLDHIKRICPQCDKKFKINLPK